MIIQRTSSGEWNDENQSAGGSAMKRIRPLCVRYVPNFGDCANPKSPLIGIVTPYGRLYFCGR